MSANHYRDKTALRCMGHPLSVFPCVYEPAAELLEIARQAFAGNVLTEVDFRCIQADTDGFPGKVIVRSCGTDLTGKIAKKAKYWCERAYAKLGRRVCELCQILWTNDRPKGPRLTAEGGLRYQIESFPHVKRSQGRRLLKVKHPGRVQAAPQRDGSDS